jgi:hypothetical protein
MVTPEVVGLVGIVWLTRRTGGPEIDGPIAPDGDFAVVMSMTVTLVAAR